ncbi:hypothetical protein IP92_05352 [Pseudoduganella flava]|uniref:Uncharacterized protein n=1 Tax=Pseudoduganella flava TaxID=871742 RepID=A0A562PGA6_9BURK|nr:hypothetical protein [Pseudoduganella flava]QGZ38934.1 hypothetical protein GO485_07670 [Pseudoduganella flava]TWI43016.1 hypothetical protein IP92_05352 [Pseudoduganella flava]
MEHDQKLVEAVRALLSDAGYGDIATRQDDNGVLLTGTRGRGGVVMRLTADMGQVARDTEHGGPETTERSSEAVFQAPALEGVVEALRANPELAKSMRIPEAHLKHLR